MNNLDLMKKRLQYQGGTKQEDRMIKGKYNTLLKTLLYSYQGCDVCLVQSYKACVEIGDSTTFRALITPNKLKQDYDDKVLSIDYATGFNPGDVFKWKGTDTNWIIYLQALTEDAYFRGDIRRCRYKIKFKDSENNLQETWAAIRGPVETKIESIQKNQIRLDNPNLSLNILMPLNDKTLEAFDRYKEFLFADRCWQVQATDSISMKNILEVNAEEYYIDRETDDTIEEIKNGLVIEPVNPSPDSTIEGGTFIKPKIAELYKAPAANGTWTIKETNSPVCLKVVDELTAQVLWNKTTSGQFTLVWTNGVESTEKIIVVESLF